MKEILVLLITMMMMVMSISKVHVSSALNEILLKDTNLIDRKGMVTTKENKQIVFHLLALM